MHFCVLHAGLLDKEQAIPMLADPDMPKATSQVVQSLGINGGQRFAEQTGTVLANRRCGKPAGTCLTNSHRPLNQRTIKVHDEIPQQEEDWSLWHAWMVA